jgi:competence protein ComEC
MAILLFFSVGIILAGYLPALPSFLVTGTVLVPVLVIAIFLRKKFIPSLWFLALAVGFFYGVVAGHRLLGNQLLDNLTEQDLVVEGQVIDLPQENNRRQLFTLRVKRAYSPYRPDILFEQFPTKINISSYAELRVKTGEQWRVTVKLRKPRGFVNPGGFDYQASLLRRGVGATGYIRQGENLKLQPQPKFSMDVLRYELQQWLIKKSESPEKGILVALLVGDTSLVDKDHWGEMIKTGTNHLIAISGLHLGFFAIIGFFIGNLIGRFVQLFWHKYPSMMSGYVFSVLLTLFYSVIAGLNIPTIRTLIMLAAVQLALLLRRSFRARDTLLIALVLVLLYDPLAAYDMGFWLSFCAVAMLIFCFSGRITLAQKYTLTMIAKNHVSLFVKSQWVMFIGLLIPLAILIHTSSLLAPPANFIGIPLITFFVVPCLILSALCHFSVPSAEDFFLHCAEWGMSVVHEWLNYLLVIGGGKFNPIINFNPWAICLAILSVFLILLPRGLGNKYIGVAGLLLALFIPLKQLPDLHMLVFDVGQGTAVFIRTPNHQLLYDTGPIYTENFDAGSGIIVPYLQSQGVHYLDKLVVSHNDQDHSGGLIGVLAATKVNQLWMGEPDKFRPKASDPQVENCHVQKPWQWDQVTFRFITWPLQPNAKANNNSCVLLVEFRGHKILLTGDIEKEVERTLLAQESLTAVDVLLAPHHGSHSSSTLEFVAQVQPKIVIYSTGFHNQHGHPHADIQARYLTAGSVPLNTAFAGALEFEWQGDRSRVTQYRQSSQRYWFDRDSEAAAVH